jgi:hypothetical protein
LPAPGKSGAEFVSPGAGGLLLARSLAFGPDGNLYVVSEMTDAVLRFDGQTGNSLGSLVASGVGGLSRPRGLLFHSDGYLYVTSVSTSDSPSPGTDSILRFDAVTGAPAGLSGTAGDAVFIPTGLGGLDNPSVIVFHNGDFYVSSTNPSTSNSVLRYRADGGFRGAFVTTGSGGLAGPVEIAFRDGYLYVTSWTNNKVLRYNGSTGTFVDTVVDAGGLAKPLGLLFEPSGNFLVSSGDSDEIRRYGVGSQAAATISLNNASADFVSVSFETTNGTAVSGNDYSARAGIVTFAPGEIYKTVLISTIDDTALEGFETFSIRLSNPSGNSQIIDGEAAISIQDNEVPPTKFYVVDSADIKHLNTVLMERRSRIMD